MNNTLGKVIGRCRLGICFSAMLGFAGSGYAAGDAAGIGKFELTIIQTTVGGNDIVAGELSSAVEKINTALRPDSKYAKNSNLCVAYTAQGELASAKPHCKSALNFSRSSRYGMIGTSKSYTSQRNMQAMALNNLGVWHAMQGESEQAQTYFELAASRSKDMVGTTSRNIDVLERRMTPDTIAAT